MGHYASEMNFESTDSKSIKKVMKKLFKIDYEINCTSKKFQCNINFLGIIKFKNLNINEDLTFTPHHKEIMPLFYDEIENFQLPDLTDNEVSWIDKIYLNENVNKNGDNFYPFIANNGDILYYVEKINNIKLIIKECDERKYSFNELKELLSTKDFISYCIDNGMKIFNADI